MKTVYGVFGDPVEHSMSPIMHNAAFRALDMDCEYHKFRVTKRDLRQAILGAKAMGFGGLNLTLPLKEEALNIVKPDPMAEAIGAVNTVQFTKGAIIGYNTDGLGAMHALKEAGVKISRSNVLILGAGGAARAVAYQLARDGAFITIANRTPQRARSLAETINKTGTVKSTGLEGLQELVSASDIVINTTSVGMHPRPDETLITSDMMHPGQVIFDLVYNPLKTRLLEEAAKAGAGTIDGIRMLVLQGAESFRIWTGEKPPVDIMDRAVRDIFEKR